MSERIINDELQAAYALNLCTVSVSQIIDSHMAHFFIHIHNC